MAKCSALTKKIDGNISDKANKYYSSTFDDDDVG